MKKFFLLAGFIIFTLVSSAQYTREDSPTLGDNKSGQNKSAEPYDFWKHISVGGGFGLQFGTFTIVSVSPLFNYHFDKNLEIGIGPMYEYFKYSDPNSAYSYSTSLYGGRAKVIYFLPGALSNLFLIGEYDLLNVPDDYSPFSNVTRATIGIPLLGLGLRRPISDKSYLSIEGLWDFSGSVLSPYANPIIAGGIDIGI